jgi:hypothetical protein
MAGMLAASRRWAARSGPGHCGPPSGDRRVAANATGSGLSRGRLTPSRSTMWSRSAHPPSAMAGASSDLVARQGDRPIAVDAGRVIA